MLWKLVLVVGQTRLEWHVVNSFVFIMENIGLVCLGYFFAAAAIGGIRWISHPVSITIEAIGAVEILWYLLWFLPYRSRLQASISGKGAINGSAIVPEPLSREQRAAFLSKCMSLVPDMEQYLRGWGRKAHFEDLRRENIKDWLLWALFDREGPPGADDEELELYVKVAEKRLGYPIKPGRGECDVIRLSFDPVLMRHRSLLFYTGIGIADTFTTIFLYFLGFRFYRQKRSKFFTNFPFRPLGLLGWNQSAGEHLSYFCRPHRSPTKRPVLFIHGVGIGLLAYLQFFLTIPRDVGVVAVELLPVSSRICDPMPCASDLASSISAILDQQGRDFDDVVCVANSYGTFLITPMLLTPSVACRINSLVLIDPVAFLLHLPDVVYNFSCRKPKFPRGNELEMWLVAQQPRTSHTLGRRLSWREHILWRELVTSDTDPLRTTVIVAEKDCVINAAAVASYVESGVVEYTPEQVRSWASTAKRWTGSRQLELIWMSGVDHGNTILDPMNIPTVARVVGRYCVKEGTGLRVALGAGADVPMATGSRSPVSFVKGTDEI